MRELELLTDSKNIDLLPSTDVSRLVPTRAFSGIYIGKRGQKMTFQKTGASFSGHQVVRKLRFLAQWQILLISRAVQSPFLKILILRHLAAIFGGNFSRKSEKRAKMSPKWVKKSPKFKIFKTRLRKLALVWFLTCIFPDFPIQIPENARVGANFVASYLGSRCELRGKWAHFGN